MKKVILFIFVFFWISTFIFSLYDLSLAHSSNHNQTTEKVLSSTDVPQDFEFVYGSGAVHAEWGRSKYTIKADGKMIIEIWGRMSDPDTKAQTRELQLTTEEIENLWQKIQSVKFFQLKEDYSNRSIMDGSSSFIVVRANGREHTVSVMNTTVKSFDEIVNLVDEMVTRRNSKSSV